MNRAYLGIALFASTGLVVAACATASLPSDVYVASVSCDGHTWSTGNCAVTGKEIGLSVDATACECANPGYIARPCIGNENWGGINTLTCSSPPTQTVTVECK